MCPMRSVGSLRPTRSLRSLVGPIAVGLIAAVGWSSSSSIAAPPGYLDNEALAEALGELASSCDDCSLRSLGSSDEGWPLHLLTLSDDRGGADERPALLITAGLDGRHLVGTETALRVARDLLENHRDLLSTMTVYIVPRANPDGAKRNFGSVDAGYVGNSRPVDEDRDGRAGEDGPVDLNGDGLITMMRRLNPPIDEPATHLADPAEPRLLKKPDAAKGERAIYTLYPEGLDQDGDGLIAEDGDGSVDPDRNFPHQWPDHDLGAGQYQLSEPEAHAIATFVLAHRNIVAAITYGRHDTLVKAPDGRGKDVTGRGPKNIDAGDVELYKEVSRLFAEITEQKRAPTEDSAGSLHAWLYAQRGLPSFATVVWGRPDLVTEDEADEDDGDEATEDPAAEQDGAADGAGLDHVTGSWTGLLMVPEMGEMSFVFDLELAADNTVGGTFSAEGFSVPITGTYSPDDGHLALTGTMGGEVATEISLDVEGDSLGGTMTGPDGGAMEINAKRSGGAAARVSNGDGATDKSDAPDKPEDAESAAWLELAGETDFVAWQPFDHPTLGEVEIGGFAPLFRINPPADQLDDLAKNQTEFAVEVMGRRAQLTVEGPVVTRLADGLYEIDFAIVNDGYFPTATAQAARNRALPPTVVRLSTPVDHITTGARVARTWAIAGSGGRFTHHWIIRAAPGSALTIDIVNAQLGDRTITFTAE